MASTSSVPTNIIIYAIPGSQFVFKVLGALQSRNIPHYVHFVPTTNVEERKKVIPSGSHLVPEMQVGIKKDVRIIVSDSEKILHWLDDNIMGITKLYPTPESSELSERASTKTLAGMVWYYNWVNQIGYENSVQKTIATAILPSWVPIPWWLRCTIADYAVSSFRSKHKTLAASALQLLESELDDEPMMRDKLINELKFYQNLLSKTPNQEYLVPSMTNSSTKNADNEQQQAEVLPSAVDMSVYAQIERLVGDAGKASDFDIYPALPEFVTQNQVELQPLWQWHAMMQQKYPIQFNNKRVPPDVLQELQYKK